MGGPEDEESSVMPWVQIERAKCVEEKPKGAKFDWRPITAGPIKQPDDGEKEEWESNFMRLNTEGGKVINADTGIKMRNGEEVLKHTFCPG
jgi:hypothetical protein